MKGWGLRGLVVAGMFFLPVMALAQVTASVVGTVQDTSGAVIPGVAVTVRSLETGAARTVTTDDRGYYRALSLPVGRYEVAAEKTGFQTQLRTGITLVVGQEAVVNLNLEVGEIQQTVTVAAEAPLVNTTTASTSGLVGEQQVKDLPLNGRSFDNLLTLNPGTSNPTALRVAGGAAGPGNNFNIAGRRGTDNLFLLNGIEYTGASEFGQTPGGASGQLLGIDAVREFNVQTNNYGAEYGKRAGGQISVVTMSGTNQLHASLFEFLRNGVLDARRFFDKAKPQFKRNDFGAAAGGPIRKDRTFLFGNYEGYRQRLTTTNVSFVPDANARRGFLPIGPGGSLVNVGLAPGVAAYFALYPDPNGPALPGGIAQSFMPALNPVQEDFGTLRMDQIFSVRDSLSGSYTIDDGSNITPAQNPFSGFVINLRTQVVSLEETHTFSPSFINIARAGFSRAAVLKDARPLIALPPSLSFIAGLPVGQILVGGATLGPGALSAFGAPAENILVHRNLFTYSDSVQIVHGQHQISLGGWSQRIQVGQVIVPSSDGQLSFPDLQSFLLGRPSSFSGGLLSGAKRYSFQWEGAWYANDTIKILPNLTLNLGLRHEFTNGWNVHPLRPVNYLFGPGGVVQTQPRIAAQMFTENNAKWLLSPRVGLAWDPFGKGKTSIHAGFGTYYNLLDDLGYLIPPPGAFSVVSPSFPFQVVPGAPLPGGLPQAVGLFPSDAKTPTVEEWSFLVEQELAASTALSVGYIGSRGYHMLVSADVNPNRSVICSGSLGNCPAGISDGTKYYPTPTLRLNPSLANARTFDSIGYTTYHSLQIDLRQRLTKGLTFRTNYSLSKALDNASVNLGSFFSNCPSNMMDALNPGRDYGLSCYDVQHRFAFNGGYDLPIGQGKALLGGVSGPANKLLSGWKLNGIVSVQSGMPFTPLVGFANSRNGQTGGQAADRPSWNPNFSGRLISGTPNQWFDPKAFMLPPAGTYGNVARNPLRGPGLSTVDLSLFKDTMLSEKVNLQFRAEIFNLFNHANFGMPGTSLFTQTGALVGSAGVITSTLTTSREIQFGLKLLF